MGSGMAVSSCSNEVKGICPSPFHCSAFQSSRKHLLSTYPYQAQIPSLGQFPSQAVIKMANRSSRLSSCQLSNCGRKLWGGRGHQQKSHWPRSGPLPISEPIIVTLGGWTASHAYHCCRGVWSAPFESHR